MQLLVIRHAIAENRDDYATTGADDDERPLTPVGKRRMRRNAEGLRRAATHVEVLAASPLVRAQQTARILADEFRLRDVETLEALRPEGHPRELLTWLAKQSPDAVVAVVGHEPNVGALVSWCVAGVDTPKVAFKKGGAAHDRLLEQAGGGAGDAALVADPGAAASVGGVATVATFAGELLDDSEVRAVRVVALALLADADAHRERLTQPDDPEALHDFRVAVRRLRSWLGRTRECSGATRQRAPLKRLRRLATATSRGRDSEVLAAWLDGEKRELTARQRVGAVWLVRRLNDTKGRRRRRGPGRSRARLRAGARPAGQAAPNLPPAHARARRGARGDVRGGDVGPGAVARRRTEAAAGSGANR